MLTNTQPSTGPETEEPKPKLHLNATRPNATGQTIIMFVEDLEAYEKFKESFFIYHQPVGPVEKQCVQCIVDASWKLNEGSALQTRMMSGSALRVIHKLPDTNNDATNAAFASGEVVTKLTKQLAQLSLCEQRHFRTLERSLDRLDALQKARKANEAEALGTAVDLLELHEQEEEDKREAREKEAEIAARTGLPSPAPYIAQPIPPAHEPLPARPTYARRINQESLAGPVLCVNGFVFSIAEIKELSARRVRLRAAQLRAAA
jgi:hypothetical protein